jgi:hypothetical protein
MRKFAKVVVLVAESIDVFVCAIDKRQDIDGLWQVGIGFIR